MAEPDTLCPRCGAGFHCGFDDAEPCACTTVRLDEATRTELRQRYTGCLCLACLRMLAGPDPAQETAR